jgi:hypothetical protein
MHGLARLLIIAGLAAACSWSVAAQDADLRQAALCKLIQDNLARLACFDKAMAVPQAAQPDPMTGITQQREPAVWEIKESIFPIDDTPQVMAVLVSPDARSGLAMRCKERVTDLMLLPGSYLGNSESGRKVIYQINDAKPVETTWAAATNGNSLFASPPDRALALIKALPDNGTLFVRVFDFRGAVHDAAFNLGVVSAARARVAAACRWG